MSLRCSLCITDAKRNTNKIIGVAYVLFTRYMASLLFEYTNLLILSIVRHWSPCVAPCAVIIHHSPSLPLYRSKARLGRWCYSWVSQCRYYQRQAKSKPKHICLHNSHFNYFLVVQWRQSSAYVRPTGTTDDCTVPSALRYGCLDAG